MIVFDLGDRSTLEEAKDWQETLQYSNKRNPHFIQFLVGHQKDKYYNRQISYEEASEIAKERGMQYVEVNAKKEVSSIESLFTEMCQQSLELYKKREYGPLTAKH